MHHSRIRRKVEEAALRGLEGKARPEAGDVAMVAERAFAWVGLGLAGRARAVVERWRKAGVRERALARAEAVFAVATVPAGAASRLRAIGDDPFAGSVAVARHVFRGELREAVARCEKEGWFLDDPEASHGVVHGVWALAMLDDFDGAFAVIATWRHRQRKLEARAEQALLIAEARVEALRHRHGRERALLEEALAVCEDHDLDIERAYVEANLVVAMARSGDLRGAARIAKKWPAGGAGGERALAAYRDVARMELAVLEGRYPDAEAAARRVLDYCERTDNAIYACHVGFYRCLAASPAQLAARLGEYGGLAARLQVPVHLRRHRLLAQLAAAGLAPRARKLVVRTRDGRRVEPVLRLFFPAVTEIAADLCWDRVHGTLHLGGDGPFSLAAHPILRRVLETILAAPDLAIPLAALFETVWEMPYNPIVHEGKVHVALHRLRALLAGFHAGADRLLVVQGGVVRVADDRAACVIELPDAAAAPPGALADRVLAHLEAVAAAAPRELERRLGVSRSALNLALRALLADGRVERDGASRGLVYSASRLSSSNAKPTPASRALAAHRS
jgi:hypothetical protein